MYRMRSRGRLLFVVLIFLLAAAACAPELVPIFSHQGRLLDETGNPVADGNYTVEYRIFNAASGGTAAYTESQSVPVEDGLFTTSLGLSGTITPTIFAQPTWLEVTVNGETLAPRQQLQGAPYAFSLASGSAVQGVEPLARTFSGLENTGAALVVLNNDTSATGGHGLLAINRATAVGDARADVAALQARAVGGVVDDATGAYGAIITSQAYRGMYVDANDIYYAAVFDSPAGIQVIGGGCTGCTMVYYAENVGDTPISAGDFVASVGVMVDADLGIPVMQVRRATGPDDALIGVSTGAVTRAPVGTRNGVRTGGFDAADGPAAAGGYLSVAVQGLVQARAADGALAPGAAVTASADGAASAATGSGYTKALSAVDADGMVWVMLGGQ